MKQSRAWTWRQAILDSELPGTSRHILLVLGCYMNDMGGSCFPSIETLVEKSGTSKRTVLKYLGIAKGAGWIKVEQVKVSRKDGDNRGWKRNEYTASWPDEDMQSEAVETDTSSESHAEKGSAPHAPPSDNGGASDAKGGAPDVNKVVRHTHLNCPENLSNESLHPAQAPEKGFERENSENDGDDKKTIKRQFTELEGGWPSRLSDSLEKAETQWNLLTDDDRHAALARRDDYIQACNDAGRSYSIALATYLRERMWVKLPKASAKAGAPIVLKKYGHSWMAYRLWLLGKPRRIWRPSVSIQRQVDAGNGGVYDDTRWQAQFPEVAYMDADAQKLKNVHLRPTATIPSYEGFVQIIAGGAAFEAWEDWHHANDYPWIDPPKCIQWIWMPSEFPPAMEPAADDETQAYLEATR